MPCKPAGPQTRAKGLILEEVFIQPSAAEKARSSKSKDRERSEASQPHLEGSSSWLHMDRRLLTTLSDKLVVLFQSSVEESFRRLAATPANENDNSELRPTSPSRATKGQNRPYERNLSNRNDKVAANNAGSAISHRTIGSDLNNRPDKVVQILNGWKLKYSGVGVSVDNFIYRVEALTHQTLEENFALLCRNATVLFEGKAYKFCWRYHKSVSRVQWDLLCFALRTQFREERDDVDVEEFIKNRKQKTNESFDSFYDSISGWVDKLEVPWSGTNPKE